jgi:hypothetical protein
MEAGIAMKMRGMGREINSEMCASWALPEGLQG